MGFGPGPASEEGVLDRIATTTGLAHDYVVALDDRSGAGTPVAALESEA